MVLSSWMKIIPEVQWPEIIIGLLHFSAQTQIINPSYWSLPYTVRNDLRKGPLPIKVLRGEKGGQKRQNEGKRCMVS
jgi:hypothetical protein